jgi:acid phosphatase (class A)
MRAMRALAAVLVALLVGCAGRAPSSRPAATTETPRCPLPAATGGAAAFVGSFPARGTPAAVADLDAVLRAQRTRTPAEVARARSEVVLTLEDFAGVFGPGFDPARHPATEALLARAAEASRPCVGDAKIAHARPRPFVVERLVKPAVEVDLSPSFPSGHATRGALWGAILAELSPAHRDALLRRGVQIGEDRVLAGVHYPSDVVAGLRLGEAIAAALLADPSFRAALEDVRAAEWRAQGQPDGAAGGDHHQPKKPFPM